MNNEKIQKYIDVLSNVFDDIAVVNLSSGEILLPKKTHGPLNYVMSREKLVFPGDLEDWIDNLVGEEDRAYLKEVNMQMIRDARNGKCGVRHTTSFRVYLPNNRAVYFGVVAWAEDTDHLFYCCTEINDNRSRLQKMETQQEENKNRMEDLFRTAGGCLLEWNLKTEHFFAYGDYDRYEISKYLNGQSNFSLSETLACVHPADIEAYKKFVISYQSGAEEVQETLRMRMIDGNYQWTRLFLTVHFEQQGNRDRCVGVLLNVEEHASQMELYRENQERIGEYFRVMNKGMFVFRMANDGPHILYINPNASRLFGMETVTYTDSLNKGKHPAQHIVNSFLTPDDFKTLCNDGHLEVNWTDPETGKERKLQLRCRRGNKQQAHYYVEIALLSEKQEKQRAVKKSEIERELWKAVCSNVVLAVTFDAVTGQRLDVEGTVIPPACEKLGMLQDYYSALIQHMHPEDLEDVLTSGYLPTLPNISEESRKQTHEYRIRSLTDDSETYTWYQLSMIYIAGSGNHGLLLHLQAENIDNQKKLELNLQERLRTDPETGFLNKTAFEHMCCKKQELEMQESNLLLLIQIDHFANLKATLGVAEGIRVVKEISSILRNWMGKDCVAARFSEDTFLIINHNIENIAEFRKRVYDLQAAMTVRIRNGYLATVSIGVAACRHDRSKGYICAYENTKKALEQAIMNGGNKVVFYSEEMETLENSTTVEEKKDIYIRTFGYFEVFYNGRPLQFRHEKSKELLALLVDRRGGFVSSREAVSMLWEDEEINRVSMARYRKVAMRLHRMLEEYGIGEIVEVVDHKRRLNTELVRCDLYDFLSYKPEFSQLFKGSYLLNYSWGEMTAADLTNKMWTT